MDYDEQLTKSSIETPYFSLDGITTYGKVVNVLDGDTLVLVIPVLNKYFKFNCRLKNIDTCEIHSTNIKIKELGMKAKYRVIDIISKHKLNCEVEISKKDISDIFNSTCSIVYVKCYNFDKYGRLLVDVYLNKNEKSLSSILIDEKLAYFYDGKTKMTEEKQLELLY